MPQRMPESLPAFVLVSRGVQVLNVGRLPGEPRVEPVGAICQVLFEHRRGARCQFVAHHVVGLAQVTGKRGMFGDESFIAEDAQYAPGQHRRSERRGFRHRNDMPDLPPQPLGKVRKLDVRADAETVGGRELDVPPDRCAGHDDFLALERRLRWYCHRAKERVTKALEADGEI